ncbi:MAG TPA: flagellar hook-associated protein FlgL [Tepidisphaeraceae bacterium]|jgi:flagellar hook-associated protein 3 FlgL|nr:flagellar hook-associated protein FlgL [Tepidisphaeraceae bacterium]
MAILPLSLARVSQTLQTDVATGNINRTEQQLLEVQNELSTGKRVNVPSDDPGASAIIQQLQKTLEQRQSFSSNIKQGSDQLGEVDSTLGDLSDLMRQAQTLASANVGSDVTADQRASAAAVAQSIYSQVLDIGNKQYEGVYLFGGDRSTTQPFVDNNGAVEFVGSPTVLQNQYDENSTLSFMVDGDNVFGALSTRVQGSVDLSPNLETTTRLIDVKGANGDSVHLGSIALSDGTTTKTIDLSKADTVGDVVDLINNAGVGTITASVTGQGITLNAGAADDISVNEVGGGKTAADLGILTTTGGGAGVDVTGASLQPQMTELTQMSDLAAGAGIDQTSGLQITNGTKSVTIDLSGATTVQDMLNDINGANVGVRAEINSAGNGINILNQMQGTNLTIGENGGTTATDLGIRSFSPNSQLSELNNGQGVRTATGADFTVTDSNGVGFDVDLGSEQTVQDVIDNINAAATTAGAGVTASFATTGNGIVLTDTAGGGGTLTTKADNFSNALADLGLAGQSTGGVIAGTDIDPVQAQGLFANIMKLRDSLTNNDQAGITAAAQGIQDDLSRVTRVAGATGAQVQDLQSRQSRLDDENTATQTLLSNLQDTDFTSAISQFQNLQTALQASLQSASKVMNLSLMDFLS